MSTAKELSERLEWVAAPVFQYFTEGRRWFLYRGSQEVGRVVKLMGGSRAYWEARDDGNHWHAPGHSSLREAAKCLLRHVNEDGG